MISGCISTMVCFVPFSRSLEPNFVRSSLRASATQTETMVLLRLHESKSWISSLTYEVLMLELNFRAGASYGLWKLRYSYDLFVRITFDVYNELILFSQLLRSVCNNGSYPLQRGMHESLRFTDKVSFVFIPP